MKWCLLAACACAFLRTSGVSEGDNLVQEVVQKGDGQTFPKAGDQVTVHYVGTLDDGSVFDSSRQRDEKFSFQIGQHQVIECWDKGVAAMSVGERANLVCPASMAYGAGGMPPVIPPNAQLHFDVELFATGSQQ